MTGLVNWSQLTRISPADLVMLHAAPPSPLPPTGFSQGEGEIKQLVVTGDVRCTSLGLKESCWPPHVIGIRVTLKQHKVGKLPLSITLAAPPPRMFDDMVDLIP